MRAESRVLTDTGREALFLQGYGSCMGLSCFGSLLILCDNGF